MRGKSGGGGAETPLPHGSISRCYSDWRQVCERGGLKGV